MTIESRLRNLGKAFEDRLDPGLISSAVEYVDFGENALAVEMLADHLFEHDAPITPDERQELFALADLTGADVERVALLEPLVKRAGRGRLPPL